MLGKLRAQLRGAIADRLFWRAAAVLGLLSWAGLAVDRWLEPPASVRAVLLGVGCLLGLVWLVAIAAPRLLSKIGDRQLLALAHGRQPAEIELISTALDLRSNPASTSPALATETLRQASEAATRISDLRITRSASEYGLAWFAAVAFAGALMLGVARPDLASRYAKRLALSEEPWPRTVTLTADGFKLDAVSGEWLKRGVRGEPFEFAVIARVAEHGKLPRTVWSRSEDRRLTTLTRLGALDPYATEQRYRRRIERLDEETAFLIRGGDARLRLRLIPIDRTRLTEPVIACTPPGYLRTEAFKSEPATLTPLPEGSLIRFRARSTKPLARVEATVRSEGATPRAVAANLGVDTQTVLVEAIQLEESSVLTVVVFDQDGFASSPFETPLETRPDTPPVVGLELDGVGRAITRDARLPTRVRIDDDHGVAAATLHLQVSGSDSPAASIELPTPTKLPGVSRGVADLLSLRSSAGERSLRVEPGDRITIEASALDRYNLAERPAATSTPVTLEVVTRAELLARLGDAQRELGAVLESLRSDVERLEYEIDLASRRVSETPDEEQGSLKRWSAERQLDARKAAQGVSQAASRAAGLRRQVINNRLDQPALAQRLQDGAAAPLRRVVDRDLKKVRQSLRRLDETTAAESLAEAAEATRRAVETLESVSKSLNSQQTYNEVVALLRGLIREQRAVNERTTKRQDDNARRLLFD